jgi:hypothetical protein
MDVRGNRRDHDRCPLCGYEFPRNRTGFTAAVIVMLLLLLLWMYVAA